MILIITNSRDVTTDFVVRELHRRSLPFRRLNTDQYPVGARASVHYPAKGQGYSATYIRLADGKTIDFSEITSVLYRRPQDPTPHQAVSDPALREFCRRESYDFLRGLWYSLDAYWVSHPLHIRRAEHKLFQLRTAHQLSFRVPETLISNDPDEIQTFYSHCSSNGGMVVKPVYLGFIDRENQPSYIYTSVVNDEDLQAIDDARYAPAIYQQRVNTAFDLRVTVMGHQLFPVKIVAPQANGRVSDWRVADVEDLQHTVYELPDDLARKCRQLVDVLGLEFAAIDFVVDHEGNHFFLEINPNGQWAWLEEVVDLSLTETLVRQLEDGGSQWR